MDNKIKEAFTNIKADTRLKRSVLNNISKKLYAKKNKLRNLKRGFAIAASCAAAFLIVMTTKIYNSEAIYISIDVNPSIALSINDFNRVIGVNYYNNESKEILTKLNLKNKNYERAIQMIMNDPDMLPYLNDARTLYVTVQANNGAKITELENSVETVINDAIIDHHSNSQVEYACIDAETRSGAEAYGLTAAKYAAIMELQKFDPTVSIENYKHHSMYDINEEIASHHTHTHEADHQCSPEENCGHDNHEDSVQCVEANSENNPTYSESQTSNGSLINHFSEHL